MDMEAQVASRTGAAACPSPQEPGQGWGRAGGTGAVPKAAAAALPGPGEWQSLQPSGEQGMVGISSIGAAR